MKFTKIKRLVSFGEHENIELEAEIEEGETVEQVHASVLEKIYKEIGRLRDMDLVRYDLSELTRLVEMKLGHKERLDEEILALKNKKNAIEKWLEKFSISQEAFDEIPF